MEHAPGPPPEGEPAPESRDVEADNQPELDKLPDDQADLNRLHERMQTGEIKVPENLLDTQKSDPADVDPVLADLRKIARERRRQRAEGTEDQSENS